MEQFGTSFDNFLWVTLAIFQTLTLDNWVKDQMLPLIDAVGYGPTVPFYLLVVLFGSYFAMQLLVAIISSKFAQLDVSQVRSLPLHGSPSGNTHPATPIPSCQSSLCYRNNVVRFACWTHHHRSWKTRMHMMQNNAI
jgi:hypothetical protein